jgi:hypothetical protein
MNQAFYAHINNKRKKKESLLNRIDQVEGRTSGLKDNIDKLSHSDPNRIYKTYMMLLREENYEQ